MNQLDKEPNEPHDQKSNSSSPSNLCKLLSIRFGALLYQMHRILGELLKRFNQNLVKSFFFHCCALGSKLRNFADVVVSSKETI